jgi:hypothetical protein
MTKLPVSVKVASSVGTSATSLVLGIYHGSVNNINDPLNLGRVILTVPQVLGTALSNWANPIGAIPPVVVGQAVYVQFLGGDRNRPVYTTINSNLSPQGLLGFWAPPGLDPTGVSNSDGAINNALSKASPGQVVSLPPSNPGAAYTTIAPILVPSGVMLSGPQPLTQSGNAISSDWGAVIKPAAAFASSLAHPAAIIFGDGTGSGTFTRMGIMNILLDMSNISAGTHVSGIGGFGTINTGQVLGVGIYQSPYRGIEQQTNGSAFCDGWNIKDVIIQAPNDVGMYGKFVDTNGFNIHVQSGGSYGWIIQGGNNRWESCRSDLCLHGFQVDSPGGNQGGGFLDANVFVNCGTQRNSHHGMLVQNGSATGNSTRAPVVLQGCTFNGDGVNGGAGGGGFAGLALGGAVVVTGSCHVLVHTEDVATGCPQYAVTTFSLGTAPGKPQLLQLTGFLNAASATIVNDTAPAALRQINAAGLASGQYTGSSTIVSVT